MIRIIRSEIPRGATLAWGVVVALALCVARVHTAGAGEIVFVSGPEARDVVFTGRPWKADGRFLAGSGAGNAMLAGVRLGSGDFAIRIWLKIRELGRSDAAVRLGPYRVRFGGSGSDSRIVLEGPGLGPGGAGPRRVPDSQDLVSEDRFFAFEARRTGATLGIFINGRRLHAWRASRQTLGEFGLEPHRASIHVFRFSASGALVKPERRADPDDLSVLQPRIDRAIDHGVDYLLRRQYRDGRWGFVDQNYPTGQTALCVYTLLKCGLPPGYPGVRQAIENLAASDPRSTYVVACHLMALQATNDPAHLPRMKQLLDRLLGWQSNGSWGYPGAVAARRNRRADEPTDLSNTQFAALGLRAARLAGLEIPTRVWSELLDATLTYQAAEQRVPAAPRPGMSNTYKLPIRGFVYRPGSPEITGSMTAAGVATLAICRTGAGRRLKKSDARKARLAIDRGLDWLAHHFSVTENPGKDGWLHYYLYGLERVGSLIGRERLGEHRWYNEGASFLVGAQGPDGAWDDRGPEPSTCFALLFLRRATQATAPARSRDGYRYASDPRSDDVVIRGFGHWPMRIWISGIRDEMIERHGVEIDGRKRLRVAWVDYLVDNEVVATVKGDPRKPWSDESYPIKHHFARRGRHTVSARVLVRPGAGPEGGRGTVAIESTGFTADLGTVYAAWMGSAARASERNLLRRRKVRVQTSTSRGSRASGERAVDGLESTAWRCDPRDESPTIILHLSAPVRARRIVLGQAASRRGDRYRADRIRSAAIRLGRESKPITLTFPSDPFVPATIELPRTVRVQRLEIRITGREAGRTIRGRFGPRDRGGIGFSEIRLEAE